MYGGVVNNQIKKGVLLSPSVKLNGECLAKLQARTWLSHALCASGHHTAETQQSTFLNLVISNPTTP